MNILSLALVALQACFGQNLSPTFQEQLAGTAPIHIVVKEVSPAIQNEGLYVRDVEADTERALTKGSVPFLRETATDSVFQITITSESASGGYQVTARFLQRAHLEKAPAIPMLISTWTYSESGKMTDRISGIRSALAHVVERFANDWRSANPAAPPPAQ